VPYAGTGAGTGAGAEGRIDGCLLQP